MSASEQKLYFLLQHAAHQLKTHADEMLLNTAGLTTAQAAVMAVVIRESEVSQKEIAVQLSQRESAITPMARRLEKAGYLTKTRSQTDGRAWSLKATREGLSAADKMKKHFGRVNAVFDDKLTETEIEQLAGHLRTLLEAMKIEEQQ